MSWTLTIGGVSVQNYVKPYNSLKVTNRGFAQTGTMSCRLLEQYPYTLNLQKEQEAILTNLSVRQFGGFLRGVKKRDLNASAGSGTTLGPRVWELDFQDYTSLAFDDICVGTAANRSTAETDVARVQWLFTTFGTHSVNATTYVSSALAGNMPAMDFTGMSLAEALNELCKYTGGKWYIDYSKNLHYFLTEAINAPFNIDVQSPNGSTTFPCRNFALDEDSVEFFNAVYVEGNAVATWRYAGGTQPPAGTQRSAYIRDSNITDLATAQQIGDTFINQQAAKATGTFDVWRPGLRAGQVIHVKNTMWGLDNDYVIQEVTPRFIDLDQSFDTVSWGSAPITFESIINRYDSAITSVTVVAADAATQQGDTIPPSTPTGLNVTTGSSTAPDGNQLPFLKATWNANAEGDLDAYEIQVDKAINGDTDFTLSASGTGGTLPSGLWNVKITGTGSVAGETYQSVIKTQQVNAGQHLYVTVNATELRGAGIGGYKVYATRGSNIEPLANGQTITIGQRGSAVEITSEGAGAPSPTYSTAVGFLNPKPYRTSGTQFTTEEVQGGWYYAVRLLAIDRSGNRSANCTAQGVVIAKDSIAPAVPTGLTANPGYRMMGLKWAQNLEPDLARYDVRWTTDNAGAPNEDNWSSLSTLATAIVLSGLDPDWGLLYFQIRAVDRSGNTAKTSDGSLTAVSAIDNPDEGWSNDAAGTYVTGTPTKVGSADISFNSVITATLSATSSIDAAAINSGLLKLGGTGASPTYLLVYNTSGVEIGRWDQNGLLIKDSNNVNRQMRLLDGVLAFSEDGGTTWTTAISADGVVADAITLGTAPGGHNNIPNASFELSAFQSLFTKVWTSAADWQTHLSGDIGIDDSGTELKLSSVSY